MHRLIHFSFEDHNKLSNYKIYLKRESSPSNAIFITINFTNKINSSNKDKNYN